MQGMKTSYDVIIAGSGPAGTSAAIHLATRGANVLLAEQKKFPRPKLCGEFISPECFEHFERLGVESKILQSGGAEVFKTVFYSRNGKCVSVPSKWFGKEQSFALGLSRAELDAHLLSRARQVGVDVAEESHVAGPLLRGNSVCGIRLKKDAHLREIDSLVTIDATGHSRVLARAIDKQRVSRKRASVVAFKASVENAKAEPGHCEIYFYRGGYGGLSAIENGVSNLCFIASARDVLECGSDPERVMREVVASNHRAAITLSQGRVPGPWLSVALESFGRRALAPADGLLAVGDAASFIDPFTGSGILMALESGELAANVIMRWLPRLSTDASYQSLANDYRARYDENFRRRLRLCGLLRRSAFLPRLAETLIRVFGVSDRMRRRVARATRPVPDELSSDSLVAETAILHSSRF